jgi:1-deoxy-D-xylulose 5-phosphate reductoisomerase
VLVSADEQAVALFLRGALRLTDIATVIAETLAAHTVVDDPDIATILQASAWAQQEVLRRCSQHEGSPVRIAGERQLL